MYDCLDLQKWRENANIPRKSAAISVHIAYSTLHGYERCGYKPHFKVLCALLSLYGVPLDALSYDAVKDLSVNLPPERLALINLKRTSLGITQAEMAQRCGYRHYCSYSLIEEGKRAVKISTLAKITDELGLPREFLMSLLISPSL